MQKQMTLKPGLKLPMTFCEVGSSPESDYDVRFTGSMNPKTRRYDLNEIAIVRGKGAAPLNGTILRTIRIQDALGHVMRRLHIELEDGSKYEWPYAEEWTIDESADGPTVTYKPNRSLPIHNDAQVKLLYAAQVYAVAAAFSLPELREVQRMLSVSQSTATRLIRQAKAEGLLD